MSIANNYSYKGCSDILSGEKLYLAIPVLPFALNPCSAMAVMWQPTRVHLKHLHRKGNIDLWYLGCNSILICCIIIFHINCAVSLFVTCTALNR